MNGVKEGKGWKEGQLDIYCTWLRLAWTKPGLARNRRLNPELAKNTHLDSGGGWVQDSVEKTDGNQHLWIWINVDGHDRQLDLIDTVAHEATHAAEAICAHNNFPFSDEPGAFLVGYISHWIWASIPLEDHPPAK